jgi:tetratricopeptide (TPR) repeat protein
MHRKVGWALFPLQLILCLPAQTSPQIPPGGGPSEVVLDLATAGPGPEQVAVATVSRSVRVVMANLAPAARYRVTWDGPGGAVTQEPPHGGYTRSPAFEQSPCGAVYSGIFDLAESNEAEASIPSRVAKLRLVDAKGCPGANPSAQAIKILTRAELSIPLNAGGAAHIGVERLSPNGQVMRKWQFVLHAPTPETESRHASEQDWIVASVVREIDLALGGSGAEVATTTLPGTVPTVGVKIAGSRHYQGAVTLAPYVWAPSAYGGVVSALLGPVAATRPRHSASAAAQHLTDLRAVVIYDESVATLHDLQAAPNDPSTQERAALVFAALAFRETAGQFSDPRLLLSRTAGRLAVARSLRGSSAATVDGQVAEALLLVLSGRPADANAACARLERQGGGAGSAWARAISLRATGDWRPPLPANATLVERLEQVRALSQHRSGSAAIAFLDSFKPEPVVDWGRILLNGPYSVEIGKRFTPSLFDMELGEAGAIRARLLGQRLPAAKIVDDLNALPGTPLRSDHAEPGIVEWGTWASFYQRHAASAAAATNRFVGQVLGLPGDAARNWAAVGTVVARWNSFPFLSQMVARTSHALVVSDPSRGRVEREQEQAPCPALIQAISKEPQNVPAALWYQAEGACANDILKGRLRRAETWFGSRLLEGTAFDYRNRLQAVTKSYAAHQGAGYLALHQIDPFDWILTTYMVSAAPSGKLGATQQLKAYGALAEYDLPGLSSIAKSLKGTALPEAAEILKRVCAMDTDSCFDYGEALAALQRSEEAAVAYRKAFDQARDRVAASVKAGWLIDFYIEQGKNDEALKLAHSAAETQSQQALEKLGDTFDRLGRYEEARRQFEAARDRYGDDWALQRFDIRAYLLRKEGRFAEQAKRALANYFPKGLTQVTMADFRQPGAAGTRVRDETPLSRQMGLAVGDTIVALNGYRVETAWQYVIVRSITDRVSLHLIVERGTQYREVAAIQKSYALGLELRP